MNYPASVRKHARHLIELGQAVLDGKPIERRRLQPFGTKYEWVSLECGCDLFSKTCSTYRVARTQQLELPKQETNKMTPERARELLPVIQAYAEGNQIQYRWGGTGDWCDCNNGYTEFVNGGVYRIKPEPKWRMWKPEEVPVGAQCIGGDPTDKPNPKVDPIYLGRITFPELNQCDVIRPHATTIFHIQMRPGIDRWYWPNDPSKTFPVGVLEESES